MEGHRWLSVTSAYNSNPWWAPRYIPSSRTISLPAKTVSRPPFRPRTQESSSWGAQPKDVRFLTPPPQPLARLLSLMARRANRNDYNNDHTYLVSPFPSSSFGSMHSPHLEKNITLRGEEERVVINRCELASKRMHLRFSKKKKKRRRVAFERKAAARGFSRGQDINRQTLLSSHTHAPPNQSCSPFSACHVLAQLPLIFRRRYADLKRIVKVGEIWLVGNRE